MNLTKALKHKKKLIKQIDEMYIRFIKYNSHQKESIGYDPEQAFNSWMDLTNQLIELKTKIHIANAPIAAKIFKLGELKSLASKLRNVETKEGLHRDRYGDGEPIEYVAFINLFEKDAKIKATEEAIEALQEDIEAFNAITKI